MNAPIPVRHLHERRDTTINTTAGYVPAIVEAALRRWYVQYDQARDMAKRTDAEHAARAARLAVLCERRARWWDVLAAWTYHHTDPSMPVVFAQAAQHCAAKDRDSARFWRELAADWHARAVGEPTSDAAGALSNLHELGVAS